ALKWLMWRCPLSDYWLMKKGTIGPLSALDTQKVAAKIGHFKGLVLSVFVLSDVKHNVPFTH
ncbi:MAG: hypothetical protein MUQ05_05390, partial [Schleiferiaceae bacterium]|nr:hypothetical protein [Schleiferiaceae bacterium]